jgi:hypothetical protein
MKETDLARIRVEGSLLCYAAHEGTLDPLVAENVEPSYFAVLAEVADYIYNAFESRRTVPSPEMLAESFAESFPDIDWEEPPEERDVGHLIDSLRRSHAYDLAASGLIEISTNWKDRDKLGDNLKRLLEVAHDARTVLEPQSIYDFAADAPHFYEEVDRRRQNVQNGNIIRMPHGPMSDYVGHFEGTRVYLCVARPKRGKSFDALLAAWWAWYNGANVIYFSLEMPIFDIWCRIVPLDSAERYGASGYSNFHLTKGIITRDGELPYIPRSSFEDPSFANEFHDYVMSLKRESDEGKRGTFKIITPQEAKQPVTPAYVHSMCQRFGADMAVIDYLSLMHPNQKCGSERERLDSIARDVKGVATSLDIPILLPYQFNRDAEKTRTPSLSNLADGDGPGRHVDFVYSLDKEAIDDKRNAVVYTIIASRMSRDEKRFGWAWNFDNGTRTILTDTELLRYEARKEIEEEEKDATFDKLTSFFGASTASP